MATFTNISLSDMDAVLTTERGWTRAVRGGAREWVYSFNLRSIPGVTIKVWSSIHRDTGNGRRRGKDAIRVCAVRGDQGYIRSTRVNRVEGWRENLRSRITEVIGEARQRAERESRPAPSAPALSADQQRAADFLRGYNGSFAFLTSMQERVRNGWRMSEGQWNGVMKCMRRAAREQAGAQRRAARERSQATRREPEQPAAPFGRNGSLEEVTVNGDPWA